MNFINRNFNNHFANQSSFSAQGFRPQTSVPAQAPAQSLPDLRQYWADVGSALQRLQSQWLGLAGQGPAAAQSTPPAQTQSAPPAQTQSAPPAQTQSAPPAQTQSAPPASSSQSSPSPNTLPDSVSPDAPWIRAIRAGQLNLGRLFG